MLADPEVRLPLTGAQRTGRGRDRVSRRARSARDFYGLMQKVQLSRQRNGAYGWSIARDIADPELWTERYHCPTWLDYLRQRNRPTQSERALHQRAMEFHMGPEPVRVRRMLERPFGSVRWKEDTPDRAANEVLPDGDAGGEQYVSSRCAIFYVVIPGHASSRGPGIHNHDRSLSIPGLRQVAHPGMTMAGYCP